MFANNFHALVISTDHGTAPSNRSPGPPTEVVAITQAAIEYESLNVGKRRAVLEKGSVLVGFCACLRLRYRNAKDMGDLQDWGYINPGQNIRDPLLGMRYANEDLPKSSYMFGAEYSILASEARQRHLILLARMNQGKRIGRLNSRRIHKRGLL